MLARSLSVLSRHPSIMLRGPSAKNAAKVFQGCAKSLPTSKKVAKRRNVAVSVSSNKKNVAVSVSANKENVALSVSANKENVALSVSVNKENVALSVAV